MFAMYDANDAEIRCTVSFIRCNESSFKTRLASIHYFEAIFFSITAWRFLEIWRLCCM